MNGAGNRVSFRYRLVDLLHRLIGLADDPTDDDDARLRKHVGVVAGYINVVGPLFYRAWPRGFP